MSVEEWVAEFEGTTPVQQLSYVLMDGFTSLSMIKGYTQLIALDLQADTSLLDAAYLIEYAQQIERDASDLQNMFAALKIVLARMDDTDGTSYVSV